MTPEQMVNLRDLARMDSDVGDLLAEVERLRKLESEQRISDAKFYSEIIERKEAEVERLRADYEHMRDNREFVICERDTAREERNEAEARLREVVKALKNERALRNRIYEQLNVRVAIDHDYVMRVFRLQETKFYESDAGRRALAAARPEEEKHEADDE